MTKPQIPKLEAEQIIKANRVSDDVVLVGIGGYYLDTFGKRGENDRGVYDDAILLISPRKFETFRANTDPSVYRKGIATMKTGVHRYYKGKHKNRYWALRLVGETVPVTRDGETGDKVGVALNIHMGGWRTTGSEGCQTLMPNDWDDFIELVYDEMNFYGQKTIPYVLIEETMRRRGIYQMPHIVSLDDREIDNLLIRFDKQDESAAQVDNLQIPTEKTAEIPPTPESESQPQNWDVSAMQPIQNILDEAVKVPDCFGKAEKQFEPIADKIKNTARRGMEAYETAIKVTTGKTRSYWLQMFGILMSLLTAVLGYLKENWKLIALGLIGVVILAISIAVIFTIINHFRMKYAADPTKIMWSK